jgi:putative intracellular protease/amidase
VKVLIVLTSHDQLGDAGKKIGFWLEKFAAPDATRRFHQDPDAQAQLAHTAKLVEVSADDFDAVFYPGGHEPLWDLADNPQRAPPRRVVPRRGQERDRLREIRGWSPVWSWCSRCTW